MGALKNSKRYSLRHHRSGLAAVGLTTAGPVFITFPISERRVGIDMEASGQPFFPLRSGLYRVESTMYIHSRTGATVPGIAYAELRVGGARYAYRQFTQAAGFDVSVSVSVVVQIDRGTRIEILAGIGGGDGNVNPTVNSTPELTWLVIDELPGGAA